MKYAWVEFGVIRDLTKHDPFTIFTPDIAALYNQQVPSSAKQGDGWDGAVLTPAVPPIPPAPVPAAFRQQLSAMEFQFLFTNTERIAVAAAVDVNIVSMRNILTDARSNVFDLTANYLVDYFDALQAAGLITQARKNKMLAGKFPKNT